MLEQSIKKAKPNLDLVKSKSHGGMIRSQWTIITREG